MVITSFQTGVRCRGLKIGEPCISIALFGSNFADYTSDSASYEVSGSQILELINKVAPKKTLPLWLIGGEPLLQVDFLKKDLAEIRANYTGSICLETNSSLPDYAIELGSLIDFMELEFHVDYEKEWFLTTSFISKVTNCAVIYQLKRGFLMSDLQNMMKWYKKLDKKIPLILEPATPFSGHKLKTPWKDVERAISFIQKHVSDFFIRPNIERLLIS